MRGEGRGERNEGEGNEREGNERMRRGNTGREMRIGE